MNTLIVFLSLLISGLLVGNEMAVAFFIHPVLYSVPEDAHACVVKPLAGRLGRFMPPWYALTLLFAILQLLVEPRGSLSWWLCCAAVVLMALIIIVTIVLLVPIDNRIGGLAGHAPALGSVPPRSSPAACFCVHSADSIRRAGSINRG